MINAVYFFLACVLVCSLSFVAGCNYGYSRASAENAKQQLKIYNILLQISKFLEKQERDRK